ncbi:MAG: Na+/H+ antiporter NhaC [Tissierellia bacterium]|nr:Na+/H+ antiporter NhaC [Tissierellia bacterium]
MLNEKKISHDEKEPTFFSSLIAFILSVSVIMIGILYFGLDPHIPLVFATAVAFLYGTYLRIPAFEIESKMIETCAESMNAMLIILVIGMLIAGWMSSGTVPYLVYVGLQTVNPKWFLPFVILMCALLSSITGSSWTTIGTIGVAFIGISIGLGIPVGITAGAVASGAFFGDKQSPISDFAIFASGVTKVNIYKHCRNMLYTTGPALIISTIIFGIIGLQYSAESIDMAQIDIIRNGLAEQFKFSLIVLIPLIALILTIVLKLPGTASLFIGAFVGILVGIFYQGFELGPTLNTLFAGFVVDSNIEEITRICNRGGIMSMMYTLAIMACSLSMAGVFERTKILSKIVEKLEVVVKRRVGLIVATLVTGVGLSYFACDPYIAAIIPAKAFEHKYKELGLDMTVLSRTISDGGVNIAPIVPWGSSGVFTSTSLGVPVLQFLPFYFMGPLTIIMAIVSAITGWGIIHHDYSLEESDLA